MEGFWRAAPRRRAVRGRRLSVWRVDAQAQAKKEAPLEIKGDASVRPWKRYAGWPARDESKWNTLGQLSLAAGAEGAAQARRSDHRRRGQGRQAGRRSQPRRLVSRLPCDGSGRQRGPAGQCRSRSVGNRQCRARGRVAVQLHLRRARLQSGHGDAALGRPRRVQRPGNQRHGRVPEDAEDAGGVQDRARRSEQTPGAGREARKSRSDRKSRHVGGGQGAGALEAEELGRLLLQHLPQRSERRRSRPGRRRCRNGSRGSTRCWASRSSSPATPRPPPAPTG